MAKAIRTRKTAQDNELNFPEFRNTISQLFPESGKILLTGSGKDFVERIGLQAIRNAVICVLVGENLRAQTEPLSRRRITQVSGAIIAMFTNGYLNIPDFQEKISKLAIDQLKISSGNANVWPAQWLLGLTGKSVQNVLRNKPEEMTAYVKDFENAIAESARHCSEQLGDYRMTLGYFKDDNEQNIILNWEGIARITTAIGAQTLSIRGSDKSMYGKLFEKLVLGSALTLLGFERVDRKTNRKTQGVFWLSDSTDTRESDATVIVVPGRIARFDIGFIGPGNSEIPKDKLSRFANSVENASGTSTSQTFVVVDRLPETSKTIQEARKSGAVIIQMSMQYWPKALALKLREVFNLDFDIIKYSDHDLSEYINEHVKNTSVQDFLTGVTVEEIEDEITQVETTPETLDEE